VEGPPPPAALRARILAAAREESPTVVALRPRRTRAYAAVALAAVACAALAIGLYAGLSGGGSSNKRAMSLTVANGVAQLTVTGLPAAPAGKAYEIWVINGEAAKPAGLFAGGGKTVVQLTRPVLVGSTVAVTLERAGGARAPTTAILLSTRLSA